MGGSAKKWVLVYFCLALCRPTYAGIGDFFGKCLGAIGAVADYIDRSLNPPPSTTIYFNRPSPPKPKVERVEREPYVYKPPEPPKVKTRVVGKGNEPLKLAEIDYIDIGPRDAEPLVMIHGYSGSKFTFSNVAHELAKDYRVIVYDKRGNGNSVARGNNYNSRGGAADLKALLDGLGIEKAHVLGFSLGGRTMMKFCAENPERVLSAISEDMAFRPLLDIYPLRPKFKTAAAHTATLSGTFPTLKALESQLYQIPFHLREGVWMSAARQHADGTFSLQSPPEAKILEYGYGITEDMTSDMKKVQDKLLVLRAERSDDINEAGKQHILTEAPLATIVEVPNSVHNIHDSNRTEFLRALREFLARNKPAGELKP